MVSIEPSSFARLRVNDSDARRPAARSRCNSTIVRRVVVLSGNAPIDATTVRAPMAAARPIPTPVPVINATLPASRDISSTARRQETAAARSTGATSLLNNS